MATHTSSLGPLTDLAELEILQGYSDLVTRYTQSLVSFPAFLDDRRQSIIDIKHCLSNVESDLAERLATAEPRSSLLFVGPGIRRWPHADGAPALAWRATAPGSGLGSYPALLDLLDSPGDDALIRAASRAAGPTWKELSAAGLCSAGVSVPRWDDIHGGHGDNVLERYVLGASTVVLAALGEGHGIIVRCSRTLDAHTRRFITQLVSVARITGLAVAIEAELDVLNDEELGPRLKGAVCVPDVERTDGHLCAISPLAVTPRGMPLHVLARLGYTDVEPTCIGPGGEPYVALSTEQRELASRALSADSTRALSLAVFDAWPADGRGYLRRAEHAIASGNPAALLAQHTALTYGLWPLGRDLLYQHFVTLCDRLTSQVTINDAGRANALIGAGRLAGIARNTGGSDESLRYFEAAYEYATHPIRAHVCYSLANTNALTRTEPGLSTAEHWYSRGFASLPEIGADDDRAAAKIRFLNGLALVRYFRQQNNDALALEREALELAQQHAGEHPSLARWAVHLVSANLATLFERRFADPATATSYLTSNLHGTDMTASEHARLELARFRFDGGHYSEVVSLLSPRYESLAVRLFDQQRELLARMLLSLSFVMLDDHARANTQRTRLRWLCLALATPKTLELMSRF